MPIFWRSTGCLGYYFQVPGFATASARLYLRVLTDMGDNHVDISGLSVIRGRRTILEGVSLQVPRNRIIALMGPSGSGKTTLLQVISGHLRPDSGSVLVDGESIPDLTRQQLFAARRRMGRLFQRDALFTDLSVFENVAFPLRTVTRLSDELIRNLVLILLEAVGLRGARDLMPAELSGGMAHRVALARAFALDPRLVMYDEPFAGLDPIAKGAIVKLIRSLNHAFGVTSILVTHDLPEAESLADYIYLLWEGRIAGEGTPAELQRHNSPRVRQFVCGRPDGPVSFHYPAKDYALDLLQKSVGGRRGSP